MPDSASTRALARGDGQSGITAMGWRAGAAAGPSCARAALQTACRLPEIRRRQGGEAALGLLPTRLVPPHLAEVEAAEGKRCIFTAGGRSRRSPSPAWS
jgi:hypothetical protein